jgi:hypothetical protein
MIKMAVAFITTLIGALFITAGPVAAHHSAAMFDETKRVELKGTVVRWEWANPHCLLQFDAQGEDGKTVRWVVETSNPLDMANRGWSKNNFKAGDTVTVTFRPARSGVPLGNIVQVQLADGRILSASNAPAPAPAKLQ